MPEPGSAHATGVMGAIWMVTTGRALSRPKPSPGRPPRRARSSSMRKRLLPYGFVSPAIFFMAAFFVFPLLMSFLASLRLSLIHI